MMITNLTRHTLSIYGEDGRTLLTTLPPADQPVRLKESALSTIHGSEHDPIPFACRYTDQVIPELPEQRLYTRLVVPSQVALAAGRSDLYSPGPVIYRRNWRTLWRKRPVGCVGLVNFGRLYDEDGLLDWERELEESRS